MEEPILIKAGDERVLLGPFQKPSPVDCRVVSEELYQKLIKRKFPAMKNTKAMNQRDIDEAKVELTKCEAMKTLLSNNILAAEIHIAGMTLGVCNNSTLITAVEYHEAEIRKFIKGKENEYE